MPSQPPHLLIVEAPYYRDVVTALLDGAKAALAEAGATFDLVSVPGALEVPAAVAFAVESGRYDGFVVLGCIIRGETFHFDVVANESNRGLTDLALRHRLAIGNAILTTEDEAQAWVRARVSDGDKGGFAARTALTMIDLRRQFGVAP